MEEKKFRAEQSVKEVMLIVLWDMKGPISVNFLDKDATVSSASYCQQIWQNSSYSEYNPHVYTGCSRKNYIIL